MKLSDLSGAARVETVQSGAHSASRCAGVPRDAVPLVFVLPMPANATNRASGRSHWRTIHRERQAYFAACDALQLTRQLPPPPPRPFARASLRVDMVLGGHMDDDNATARQKAAIDWLVSRGYLASDRRTCLTRDGYPTQRVTRKAPASLTLTLTPIP